MKLGTSQLTVMPTRRRKVEPETLGEDTIVATSPDTLFCEYEDQVFVLPRTGEACFVLNRMAARAWKALRSPSRLGDLIESAMSGPVPVERRDVFTWIGEMAAYGLVEIGPAPLAASRLVDVAELRRVARAQELSAASTAPSA